MTPAPQPLIENVSSCTESAITVLICSANVGNAQPTAESLAAWIPEDGSIQEVSGQEGQGQFTVIVIGMQEASFEVISGTEAVNNSGTEDIYDSGSSVASPSTSFDEEDSKRKDSKQVEMPLPVQVEHIPTNVTDLVQSKSMGSKNSSELNNKNIVTQIPNGWFIKGVINLGQDVANVAKAGLEGVETAYTLTSQQVRSVVGTQDGLKGPPIFRVLNQFEENECGAELYGGDTACLASLVRDRLPSYKFVVNYLRGQMRLMLLVRQLWVNDVSDVECKAENTGLGQVLANKGGIVASITLRGTRLCFISAHLAAHEGEEYYKARNASLEKILRGAKVGPKPQYWDASIYNHHTFLCGDLNYRVKLDGEFNDHEDHVKKAFELVNKKDWMSLNKGDELAQALLNKDCLAGFQTPLCNFNPTFKLKREAGYVYNPQRTPSYTDRVLWKSLDGLEKSVKQTAYHPCPGYITSDHKPIRAAFEIIPSNTLSPKALRKNSLQVSTGKSFHIFISDIKCRDLVMGTKNGDPYVNFVTNPLELLVKKEKLGTKIIEKTLIEVDYLTLDATKDLNALALRQLHKRAWPATKTLSGTTNPDWGNAEIRLELQSHYDRPSKLKGTFLYLNVFDDDTSNDDLVGTVEVNLMNLAMPEIDDDDDEDPLEVLDLVDRPILKNGRVRGYLSCEISGWWFNRELRIDDVREVAFQEAKSKRRKMKLNPKKIVKRRECIVM